MTSLLFAVLLAGVAWRGGWAHREAWQRSGKLMKARIVHEDGHTETVHGYWMR